MKACHRQNPRPAAVRPAGQPAPVPVSPVHRYAHPIRTTSSARRGSTEELLTEVLDTLSRQEKALEELLRRTPGGPDTI